MKDMHLLITRQTVAFATLFLVSCASLSESECQSGNWQAIGYRDGSVGRLPTYFAKHANACSQYGIATNQYQQNLWEQGRQQGLKQYCTPQNAYRIGQSGKQLAPVCLSHQQSSLYNAHRQGIAYHELNAEIRRLQKQRKQYQKELNTLLSTPQNENVKFRVAHLQKQITELAYRIKNLRQQAQNFRPYF